MSSRRSSHSILPLALMVGAIVACGSRAESKPDASVLLDDFSDTVRFAAPAARIVSLNPVTTELLFALGAQGRLVGRTSWDAHPAAAREIPDVGNGMQPNVEAVLGQRPDLVILYASPSNRAAALRLRQAGVMTLALRTDRILDFTRTARWLGRALGDSLTAQRTADSVTATLDAVRALPAPAVRPTVLWPVWRSPLMVIGAESFLSELVSIAGGTNLFDDLANAAPQVTLEEVVKRNPTFILSGPGSAEKLAVDPAWRALSAVREGRLLVIDTTLTGRPGVRMGEAARHLRALLVPQAAP